jgi:peptidoglycan/LPS O-acetylase OafA/YrhL
VGLASYSLFLWHYPVLIWLRDHDLTLNGKWLALAVNFLLIGLLSGALSALSYRFVELPALRRKRSVRARPADTEAKAGPPAEPALEVHPI